MDLLKSLAFFTLSLIPFSLSGFIVSHNSPNWWTIPSVIWLMVVGVGSMMLSIVKLGDSLS